ncbi:hypothetical protein [Hymenobacter jejuensis]|uniref:Uncharacterized protein n=1 Tax=Hymenobacter jejuensis TaxID=2502781 RepID=A0A5B8A4T5_9BACT|nr:hypothetical protein [Hymenobacter jejuensis]QDA61736.1 hypothetical protein FHG12_17270 [Hymenobacter jejuensis]
MQVFGNETVVFCKVKPALLLLVVGLNAGCITNRITTIQDDCDSPAATTRTDTVRTAYFWGLRQPTDFKPPCDDRFNHLNSVTVKTTFGYYLLATVTLGIVVKQRMSWCCAPFHPEPGVIGSPPPPPKTP